MVCLLIRISLGNPLTRWLSITYHWQDHLVEHSKSAYPSRPDFQPLILICLNLIGDFNFQIPLESHSSLRSSCEGVFMWNHGSGLQNTFMFVCSLKQWELLSFGGINHDFWALMFHANLKASYARFLFSFMFLMQVSLPLSMNTCIGLFYNDK